ncbi:hypothetical protein HDU91_002663 [Kappamyces sp. JEL0680]|nr:hypothetical protein HDU91_002663 [Kappamyces sp. JEL0680]
MLDDLQLQGTARKTLLDLPMGRKETLLQNHQKERKKNKSQNGFWNKLRKSGSASSPSTTPEASRRASQVINEEEIAAEFLVIVGKGKYAPDEIRRLLSLSIQEKEKFVSKYRLEDNQEAINSTFLDLIGKKSLSPDQMKVLLAYSLADRALYIADNQQSPSVSPRASLVLSVQEKSPAWFVLKLTNRNLSLKTLFRHLQSLRACFMLNGGVFMSEFITAKVQADDNCLYTGSDALEIALERVNIPTTVESTTLSRNSIDANPSVWYADQIFPDEIRLEALKCIELMTKSNAGMFAIMEGTLVVQIVRCA